MHPATAREVRRRLQSQHGVISRAQLRGWGVADAEVRARIRRGEWETAARGVLRAPAARPTPEQHLWVALLAAGPHAFVSHESAAWLWGMVEASGTPVVSVARGGTARIAGATVHRPRTHLGRIIERRGLPCTDPQWTLVDLATAVDGATLDAAVDRVVARGLVSIAGLESYLSAVSTKGRVGPRLVRTALERRGYAGAPTPSVLESRFRRLLEQGHIVPWAVEVPAGDGGRYRIDTQLSETVFAEVDGYAYHASPEQKADDERRRNRLRMEGRTILVYTWRDVTFDGQRVLSEIRQALWTESTAGDTIGGRSPGQLRPRSVPAT